MSEPFRSHNGVTIVELRPGVVRATSRSGPGVYRLDADGLGRVACQCQAFFYKGNCGHLDALDQYHHYDIPRAPAPYDAETNADYETWKDQQ